MDAIKQGRFNGLH